VSWITSFLSPPLDYVNELLKFNIEDCKSMCTPLHPTSILTLDDLDEKFQVDPRESHLATVLLILVYGLRNVVKKAIVMLIMLEKVERKSTNEGYHFIGTSSNTYQLYTIVLNFYGSNIGLWTMTSLKNPILYSRAKHIEIQNYFIRDYVLKRILDMKFVSSNE
ncbi:hypothetical protein CR513_39303, partial [Mucuna pruriens]